MRKKVATTLAALKNMLVVVRNIPFMLLLLQFFALYDGVLAILHYHAAVRPWLCGPERKRGPDYFYRPSDDRVVSNVGDIHYSKDFHVVRDDLGPA